MNYIVSLVVIIASLLLNEGYAGTKCDDGWSNPCTDDFLVYVEVTSKQIYPDVDFSPNGVWQYEVNILKNYGDSAKLEAAVPLVQTYDTWGCELITVGQKYLLSGWFYMDLVADDRTVLDLYNFHVHLEAENEFDADSLAKKATARCAEGMYNIKRSTERKTLINKKNEIRFPLKHFWAAKSSKVV